MKSGSVFLPVLLFLTVTGLAAQTDGFVRRPGTATELMASKLKASPDGTLEFVTGKGTVPVRLAPGKYLYAWIPKPPEIAEADKLLESNPAAAETAFVKAYEKYRFLGWDLYCMVKEAEACGRAGKKEEAVQKLSRLREYRVRNPRQTQQAALAVRLSVRFLIDLKKYPEAGKQLEVLALSHVPSDAAYAFLRKGEIAELRNDPREALFCAMQAAFLFPEAPEHPEALYQVWHLLNLRKDPRARRYADELRKRYPASPFTARLP